MPPKKSGNKAVQVSMDSKLLKRIDADAETRHTGRSAYITKAILLYMRAKKKLEIDEQFRRAFAGHADEMLAEALPMIESQYQPPDDDLVEDHSPPQSPRRQRAGRR